MNSKSTITTEAGIIGSELTRITNPGGASFVTTSNTVTGAFKIKLPVAKNRSNTMHRMTVKIYTYSTGMSYTFEIGGYNYGDGNWYNYFAHQISDAGNTYTVRFGYDGNSNCVWIGDLNSQWAYPQVFVTEVQIGYSGYDANWSTGWSITPVTAFDTVTATRDPAVVITSNNIGSQRVDFAGTANAVNSPDGDRGTPTAPNGIARAVKFDFKMGSMLGGSIGNYIGLMTYAPWEGTSASTGDCSYQLAFGSTAVNGGEPRLAIRNGIDATWNAWRELITSANIGSQSVNNAATADRASFFGGPDSRLATSFDGESFVDIYSPDGYSTRVGYASSADWASGAGTAANVDWTGVNNKPTTLQGFGITGGSMTQNSTAADFLVLVNQHGASQDKSFIRFKHYTDGRESANIRAEVGYPSNGGWNGALVFSTCPVMGSGAVATDSMVLDKDGHLRLLRGNLIVAGTGASSIAGSLAVTGNITAANIKSLSAFGAKSGAIGAVGSVTAYSRNITIDGVTVTVLVTN